MTRPRREAAEGQILILFALAFTAILLMLSVLFDAAFALSTRRGMQDAADAAAMAGADAITSTGCTAGLAATIKPAVLASLTKNGYPNADQPNGADGKPHTTATITCAADSRFYNAAVTVTLSSPGTRLVLTKMPIGVDSTAMNGGLFEVSMSVVTLDPNACASFYAHGGITLRFEGGVHVNSDRLASQCNGGNAAASEDGNSGVVTMVNNQPFEVNGEQTKIIAVNGSGQAQSITTHAGVVSDPFRMIDEPNVAKDGSGNSLFSVPETKASGFKSVTVQYLTPGTYCSSTSCAVKANATAAGDLNPPNNKYLVLFPGVYVFDNIEIATNGGTICTLPTTNGGAAWTNATVATACGSRSVWNTYCKLDSTCGALLYFTNPPSGNNNSYIWNTGGNGSAYLNPYVAANTTSMQAKYTGFLLWTARSVPVNADGSAFYYLNLGGGGANQLTGTIYAPTVRVALSGSANGTGGSDSATMQFICYDLDLGGNVTLTLQYHAGALARFTGYGLVE